jgi:signal transduction histidine kinase
METVITHLMAADQSRLVAEMWERDLEQRFTSLSSEHERMAEIMRLRHETSRFIVHDLRNPLQIAMNALALIDIESGDQSGRENAQFIMMAQGGLQRMLNLIEALLDVGRLESGEDRLDLAPIDLAAIIERCVLQSQPMTMIGAIILLTDLPEGGLPTLTADAARIERVIMNLIDNAIRFTPRGEVTVRAWQDGGSVWVAVDDSGAGIPADQRDRIFDRFVQTKEGRKSTGFGLGLAFCRSAVQAHGGEIRAEDNPGGKGTRMIFSLPLEPVTSPT